MEKSKMQGPEKHAEDSREQRRLAGPCLHLNLQETGIVLPVQSARPFGDMGATFA